MPRSRIRTVVLAESLREFHQWCRANGRSPRDVNLMYATGPASLRGLTGVQVVRHGAWWRRLDAAELTAAVAALEERAAHDGDVPAAAA